MALTVINQNTEGFGVFSAEQIITPTPGNWLIAVVSWLVTDNSAPLICVGDWARNQWSLLYSTTATAFVAHPSAQLWTQVWACPNVRYDGWPNLGVYISAMSMSAYDVGSATCNVYEVAGMGNGFLTVDSVVTTTATNTGSVTLTLPTPASGANCLQIAAAAGNIAYGAYTTTGTGWAQLNNVTNTNPEVGLFSAWREGTTGSAVTFGLLGGATRNWAATAVSIRQTGTPPVQPNPNWPAVELQLGLGSTLSTPISAVTWTDVSTRFLSGSTARGIQYELGAVQSQPTDLMIRNDDGVFTPRAGGSGTATSTGTATTFVSTNLTGINVGDFFQLQTSGGVLKENSVFIVTGVAGSTVTFARADGTVGGAQAVTATGAVYAAIPIDIYVPYRWMATWNGKRYPVAAGWIERWPQEWDDPHWGRSSAVGVDAIATLTPADLSSVQGEILRRSPTHYWPLADSAAAASAQNISGVSGVALNQVTSANGGGASSSAQFGASTQNVDTGFGAPIIKASNVGDAGTGWKVSGLTAAEHAADGFALVGYDSAFPSITAGITVMGILFVDGNSLGTISSATADPTVFVLRNVGGSGAQGSVIKLSISNGTSPNAVVTVWDKNTHAATVTTLTSGDVIVAGTQFEIWAMTFNQTSWTCYTQGNVAGTGTCNLVPNIGAIDVGGEADQFFNGRSFNGLHSHVAVFPRQLTKGEIESLNDAYRYGYLRSHNGINDLISRKLDTVGWHGARVLNYCDPSTGSEIAASTIAEKITQAADYEAGKLFADAGGQLQFRGRKRAYYQTPRATIGDRPDLGEIPYVGDLKFDFDSTYLYNTVTVENDGIVAAFSTGVTTTNFVAASQTSAVRYGTRSLSKQVSFRDDHYVFDVAWWYLNQYASPKLRIAQVTIDVSRVATNAAWALCLGSEVGDLVTVNKRPIGAPPISLTCVILSVQQAMTPDQSEWQTTLTLGIAPPSVLTFNDPVYGIVGSNAVGA